SLPATRDRCRHRAGVARRGADDRGAGAAGPLGWTEALPHRDYDGALSTRRRTGRCVATRSQGQADRMSADAQPDLRPRRVRLKRKSLERYRPIVGDDLVGDIRDVAHELRGLRVLELSSTA